jgi:hypothetical protein
MWLAAARDVRNVVASPAVTGAMRSSTASMWASTAPSSSASMAAVAAVPPAARLSPATASSVASVRPARWTLARSRANARAAAPPIAPAPP